VKRHIVVLAALLAIDLATAIGFGRFTTTDEIAFKAAGREWAQSGRFAAPELSGFAHFQPPVEEIWFAHLPVYTFLFGVFVKVFGFGATQSVAFDALIHTTLALLTYRLARRETSSPWPAVLAAALVLPLGRFGRADELAICFGLAALLALPRPWLAGILFGLSAATNAVAAAFLGVIALVRLAFTDALRNAAAALFLGGAVALAACLAPILIAHPDAWRQFASHASTQFSPTLAWGLTFSWTFHRPYVLSVVATLVIALAAAILRRRDALLRFAPLFAVAIVVCFMPAKPYYLWFVTPLLFAGACATAWELRARRVMQVAAAVAIVAYGIAIAEPLQQRWIVATLPPEQRLAPNVAAIRAQVPRGSLVLGSEFWSSLANDVRYRSLVHGTTSVDDVDYVILTGNGTGAVGVAQPLDVSRFELVYDSLRRDVPRLFGVPLSHSGWGYGVRIYRARNLRMRSSGAMARSSS
jgi:hypothetical protein